MKLSSISIFLIISLALSGSNLAVAQSVKVAKHPTTAVKKDTTEKFKQKFNPIYGAEKESNDLLSFIAANMVVELDAASVKNVDGIVVVSFYLDTLGNISRMAVTKSLRPWVDYAIIWGMSKMPNYGRPSMRNNGKIYESFHNIVFSFGSYVRAGQHTYGFQGDAVRANIQGEVDRQRDAQIAQAKERNEKWGEFTTKNGRLEYDTKNGLRNQVGTLEPGDQVGVPDNLPPMMPTISIKDKN